MNTLFNINQYKEQYQMKAKKEHMTKAQYDARMAEYRKRYGDDIMLWPKHLRDRVSNFDILQEVEVKPVQMAFNLPYGNTGVSNSHYSGVSGRPAVNGR